MFLLNTKQYLRTSTNQIILKGEWLDRNSPGIMPRGTAEGNKTVKFGVRENKSVKFPAEEERAIIFSILKAFHG